MDPNVVDRRIFHRLVSLEEAIHILESEGILKPIGIEEVDLLESYGRILAEDIYAPIDYPPFDRSEVDGYGVMVKSVEGADELNPIELTVKGSINIGEAPSIAIDLGEAVEIATGAMIPRGVEGVVVEEYTERIDGRKVLVCRSVYAGENIAYAGSDIAIGELVIPRGTTLTYSEIGVLAALGIRRVKVFKSPKVFVISTGNELIEPGKSLDIGKIYDSNGYLIVSLLKMMNIDVKFYGIVKDNEEELYKVIVDALKEYDIVVTSGGTSAGLEDVVYRVFSRVGRIVVHGLKLKPGKPTVIAVSNNGKLLIGLPGFPFSAVSNALLLLIPIIKKIMGSSEQNIFVKAKIGNKIRKDIGRKWFVPVVLNKVASEVYAIPFSYSSGNISVLIKADGIALLPENRDVIDEGEYVDVLPLSNRAIEGIIMGSHDILLNEILNRSGLLNRFRVISIGSYNGVELIKKGYIDIAPIHIFDETEGLYNIPLFKKDKILREKAFLVRGYERRLVLAFRPGNPKNITSFEDILRKDIRFVNRNRGSGTRAYIDYVLRKLAEKLGVSFSDLVRRINGYRYEVSTHSGVAAAIAQGRADIGVCIEYAAIIYNLNYIPLSWESYDFIVSKDSYKSKEVVKAFLNALRNSGIKDIINSTKGYRASEDIGGIICC